LPRQYLPKKRPMKNINDEEMRMIENGLNNRACKRFGFRTLAEVLHLSLSLVAPHA
jgi:IS30 family transposase